MNIGDKVRKPKGYKFEGAVVSKFWNLSGQTRYVVENGDGILHIFNEDQIENDGLFENLTQLLRDTAVFQSCNFNKNLMKDAAREIEKLRGNKQ